MSMLVKHGPHPRFVRDWRPATVTPAAQIWRRSTVIGIAKASCTFCHGYGLLPSRRGDVETPCGCVFRAIFQVCFARYQECHATALHTNGVTLERGGFPTGYCMYSRRREEYAADFALVSRRHLHPSDYDLFRRHWLLGAEWRQCCSALHIDRGTFFHRVYAITARLGRVFAELKPYPLYPLADYFAGVAGSPAQEPTSMESDAVFEPLPGVFQWRGQRTIARRLKGFQTIDAG